MPTGHASCVACRHPDGEAIDRALRAGDTLDSIVEKFGEISRSGLSRHKARHLSAKESPNASRSRVTHSGSPLERLEAIIADLAVVAKRASRAGSLTAVTNALKELRTTNIELNRLKETIGAMDSSATVDNAASFLCLIPPETRHKLADKALARRNEQLDPHPGWVEPSFDVNRDDLISMRDSCDTLLAVKKLWDGYGYLRPPSGPGR